jgi:hypothetical protein
MPRRNKTRARCARGGGLREPDAGPRGKAQILLPRGVEPIRRHDDPDAFVRRLWRMSQPHPDIGGGPVLLAGVARPARRHDVLPRVGSPKAARDYVIDVLRLAPTVLTLVVVANEHGSARERCADSIRDLYEVVEPHDAGAGQLKAFRSKDVAVRVEHLRFPLEGKQEGPPHRNDAKRLVGRVQNQGLTQGALIIESGALNPSPARTRPVQACSSLRPST